jgi:hypothetical protein
MLRHAVGLGPVVTSKFFGEIFGWAIDENGTDGVLSEVVGVSQPTYTSIVETFDQTTQKVTHVVRKQASGPLGNHELNVDAIAAGDVALIDDEHDHKTLLCKDTYYVMDPTAGGKITGTWTRPPGKDFLIFDIADQQTSPLAVMTATILDHTISQPPTFEVVVTDIAQNKIPRVLHAPSGDGVDYPYLVAEDTSTQHAYVPAANYKLADGLHRLRRTNGQGVQQLRGPAVQRPRRRPGDRLVQPHDVHDDGHDLQRPDVRSHDETTDVRRADSQCRRRRSGG